MNKALSLFRNWRLASLAELVALFYMAFGLVIILEKTIEPKLGPLLTLASAKAIEKSR